MKISIKQLRHAKIGDDISNLRECAKTLEDLLQKEADKLAAWTEKEAAKLSEEQKDEFGECFIDDHWRLNEVFPDILRKSLFITCYSFLEHTLNDLCIRLCKRHDSKVKLKDSPGKGIERAKNYFKKVIGIKFPDQTTEWSYIVNYNLIRNKIIHNHGYIGDDDNARKIRAFIKQMSLISVDPFDRLVLSNAATEKFLDVIEAHIGQLFGVLPEY